MPSLLAAAVWVLVPAIASAQLPAVERGALDALYQATGGPRWTDHQFWEGLGGRGVPLDRGDLRRGRRARGRAAPAGKQPPWHNPTIGQLVHLVSLDLSRNALSGTVPETLGDLEALHVLDLGSAGLSGPIPESLARLSELEVLGLGGNRLDGPLPDELDRLRSLRVVVLARNRLRGRLPSWFGDLEELAELDVEGNRLDGPIPDSFGRLRNLRILHLAANRLVGRIPGALGELPALVDVSLGWNGLWTEDEHLRDWLEERNPKQHGVANPWFETQVFPPEWVVVHSLLPTSCELQWCPRPDIKAPPTHQLPLELPIGARIEIATSPDGPYEPVTTGAEVDYPPQEPVHVSMLESDTTYFLRVRRLAWPHTYNPANTVVGDPSVVVTIHTPACTTWYVDVDGDDGARCDNPERPCATLQGALDLARDGDRIMVARADPSRLDARSPKYASIDKSIDVVGLSPVASNLGGISVEPGVTASIRNARVNWLSVNQSLLALRSVDLHSAYPFVGSSIVIDRSVVRTRLRLQENSRVVLANTTVSYPATDETNEVNGTLSLLFSTLWTEASMGGASAFVLDGGEVRYGGSVLTGGPSACGRGTVIEPGWAEGFSSLGGNVVEGETCERLDRADDVLADTALLGPLEDNGGPVMTRMPRPGSLAVDLVDSAAAPPTDARGATRPQGAAVDAGACERLPVDGTEPVPRRPDPHRF